jgi:DNA-binding transcriptional LysR family regulator
MNVTFARTFVEVVRRGNLNRAAAQLNITESTVTSRLNALEAQLGQKLLVRSRAGAELTSAGFKFLRYAEIMTQAWSQAQQELSLSGRFQAVCNIGCETDLWSGAGQDWVSRLRRDCPDLALSVWPGSPQDVERWLATGLLDVALSFDAAASGDWQAEPLFDEVLVQVSTTPRARVNWDPDYIYVDLGEAFRRQHAEAYAEANTPVMTIGAAGWGLQYLLQWGGSAYLPLHLARPHLDGGRLHRVDGAPEFTRSAQQLHRRDAAAQWPWFSAAAELLKGEAGTDQSV